MSDFARALDAVLPLRHNAAPPVTAVAIGSNFPGPGFEHKFDNYVREGYAGNELVYAAIEQRATSAAEPEVAAWSTRGRRFDRHPVLDLLNHPNPFLSGFDFMASLIMYHDIAGNAYFAMVPSAAGRIVELWPIRPDRLKPNRDPAKFLSGWHYQAGSINTDFPVEEIGHFKTRNPLDDVLGMPMLMPAGGRVDLDNWLRLLVSATFHNAGVPSGLLNIHGAVEDNDKRMIQNRFREGYGGANAGNLLVIDNTEAEYKAMGMDFGARGLVIEQLDKMSEVRITMVFGVPPAIIGALIGAESSSYANLKAIKGWWWENTLAPLYRDLGDALTLALRPHFPDVGRIGFDLATVRALMPDVDALEKRARENKLAGLWTREEAREAVGKPAKARPGDTWETDGNLVERSASEVVPEDDEDDEPEPTLVGARTNGTI